MTPTLSTHRPADLYLGDCRPEARGRYCYKLLISRRALAIYLRWQFGQRMAIDILAASPKGSLKAYYSSRRAAERAEASLRSIVNNQIGRLGAPAGDHGIIAA